MGILATAQTDWRMCGQATTNTSSAAYDLAYGATWATGAQNPVNRPADLTYSRTPGNKTPNWSTRHAARLDIECNGIRMRFLVANAENEDVAATIWLWDGNGAPMNALVLNPIRASENDVEVNPATGEALTNFFYADIITQTTDNVGITTVGSGNGIAEIRFDAHGASWVFADFNTAAPSGTSGTDGICIYKEY